MKKEIITFISCLFLVSCAGKIPVAIPIPEPPKSTESVKPNLQNTREDIDNSIKNADRIGNNADDQGEIIIEISGDIDKIIKEIEKLRVRAAENGDIYEYEIQRVKDGMLLLKVKNTKLSKANDKLKLEIENQKKNLESAKKNADESMKKLILKEDEVVQLRDLNQFLTDNLALKNHEVGELVKENKKIEKKLSTARVYRNWILGLVGALGLYFIAGFLLKIYKPL